MTHKFRCDCPFTSALDVLGDRWILVIIKQMLLEDKMTFKDFVESDEAVATNILSNKLKLLEDIGIIRKTKRPENKKTNLYLLTDKGLALTPLLLELALWSDEHLRDIHPIIQSGGGLTMMKKDKASFEAHVIKAYKEKLETLDQSV